MERTLPVEADRAMELLRNTQQLVILHTRSRARVEGGADADRLAFPLAPGSEPPHLLITREGHGVTCLGRGMLVSVPCVPWPIVERYLAQQADALRARLLSKTHDVNADGSPANRVYRFPWRITRAEFDTLCTLRPLLREPFIQALVKCVEALEQHRKVSPKQLSMETAEALYRAVAFSRIALMTLAGDEAGMACALRATHLGDLHVASRALWVAANQPEEILVIMARAADTGCLLYTSDAADE